MIMIREKRSYVAGDMCDSKLKLSILAADGIVETVNSDGLPISNPSGHAL